jgi:hypothetical protein
MKKHSCGAILYTVHNNKIYIILGMEKGQWFPFKGTRESGESNEHAAIREIYEETCGITKLISIDLKCNYSTKRKHYHIGLVKVSSDIINQFYRNQEDISRENRYCGDYDSYLEKSDIRMFSLNFVLKTKFHEVTSMPLKYYYKYLKMLESNLHKSDNSPYFTSVSNKRNLNKIKTISL